MNKITSALRNRFGRSDDEDEANPFRETESKVTASRKPPNTAFRQQRLKAWQPILVPKVVLPMLLIIAVITAPLGIGFLITEYKIQLLEIDYSKCEKLANNEFSDIPSKYVSHHFNNNSGFEKPQWRFTNESAENNGVTEYTAKCYLNYNIPNDITGPVYLYYKLTNFYQNHRKYVESYSWAQLRGQAVAYDDLTSDCSPMRYRDGKMVYPCGLVANSIFNDTIGSPVNRDDTEKTYEFSQKGIAWKSDLSLYKKTEYEASQIVPPENWMQKYPNGYTAENLPDLSKDELFMNWMKTAALPSFVKLYGINKNAVFEKGSYATEIELNYPVSIFGGTKSMVIGTSSVLGGRHLSLGICYLIVACISIAFMLGFLIKQLFTRKKTNNHSFLSEFNGEDSSANNALDNASSIAPNSSRSNGRNIL
ncbi:hypothetical protein B5S30_g5101 [[Candida] boidinii]|nr:hypothetical protein B5S30_g5101 [[Candida] boidinii]